MENKYPLAQAMIDEQYGKWKANAAANAEDGDIQMWTYKQFLYQASLVERNVLVLGKLITEVNNGGFAQWRDNGYSQAGQETIDALLAIGTRTGNRMYHLVKAVVHELGANAPYALQADLETFDQAFYPFADQLADDLEAYVSRNVPAQEVGVA